MNRIGSVTLLLGLVVSLGTPAYAAELFGVAGDGAPIDPEGFFSVSTVDASTALIQPLGNGNDGESIALNSSDRRMYHWSGFSGLGDVEIMETIHLTSHKVTNVPTDFTSHDPLEVLGSTFDPSTGNFLYIGLDENLGSVTPGGVFSLIGPLPTAVSRLRALGFNGSLLYVGDLFRDKLIQINPLSGAFISTVPVTLSGFTVFGIISLTTDPDTGILYAIVKTLSSGKTGRRLATINPSTGVARDIGPLPDGFANIEFGGPFSVNRAGAVPAEILVIRDGDDFSLSSNVLNAPTGACAFTQQIVILGAVAGVFPVVATIGAVQGDGSLTVNREALLNVLNNDLSKFIVFGTGCGSNFGDFGARGFRAMISGLELFESMKINTVYFP